MRLETKDGLCVCIVHVLLVAKIFSKLVIPCAQFLFMVLIWSLSCVHNFHLWSSCPYLMGFAVCKTESHHVVNQFCPGCCVVWLFSHFHLLFSFVFLSLGTNRPNRPTSTCNMNFCPLEMCSSRKYPYSPNGRFFCFAPLPHPGNSSFASYLSSKSLAFRIPSP